MSSTQSSEPGARSRPRRLRKWLLVALLVMLAVPVANVISDHRVYFLACSLSGPRLRHVYSSPDAQYRVYLVMDTIRGGLSIDVHVSRWYWLLPRHVARFYPAYNGIPKELRGPVSSGLVWSRGGRYVAGTGDGWFKNLYDFRENKLIFWDKAPESIVIGESPEETVALNPYFKEVAAFHEKVQRLLDSDGGAVPDSALAEWLYSD